MRRVSMQSAWGLVVGVVAIITGAGPSDAAEIPNGGHISGVISVPEETDSHHHEEVGDYPVASAGRT